jgi:hypothetical protein
MASDDATPPLDDDDDDDAAGKPGYNSYNQEEADKHQAQANIDAEVAEDVLTNPDYDEFFADYQPQVRESFAHLYVLERQGWVRNGQHSEKRPGRYNLYDREAYTTLWAIQQKKLFDLQCRWRAEEVRDVPGVVITDDFATLSNSIENCPALTPITPEEFALYLDWVRQADYERDLGYYLDAKFAWQKYRTIRLALAPDAPPSAERVTPEVGAVPEWYRFHNAHTGHDRLLYLPDVRGAKQERYWDAWREKLREEEAIARAAGAPAPDPRPSYLPSEKNHELAVSFAQRFEDARLNRWRETAQLLNPRITDEERAFQHLTNRLLIIKEPVPTVVGANWRDTTRLTFHAYARQQLLENLPRVYEEYQQRQEWGIAHPSRDDSEFRRYDIASYFRGTLLEGRVRLGEPEDFDF